MKRQNSYAWLTTATTIAVLVLLSGAGAFFLIFGSALGQERDTPDVLKAILQLELSRADVVAIKGNPQRLSVRSFSSLQASLERQNWILDDRLGAAVFYHKSNQKLMANCGAYSRYYLICDLDRVP